jgi:hypothetical protein
LRLPKPAHPHIAGGFLLEKGADLLELGATRAGVVKEVAELAGARLDFLDIFLELWIALENEDLVFWATLLRERMYRMY